MQARVQLPEADAFVYLDIGGGIGKPAGGLARRKANLGASFCKVCGGEAGVIVAGGCCETD